jgi:cathepsin B
MPMKLAIVASMALLAAAQDPASDPCHNKYQTQAACDADQTTGGGCTWCKCAAVPSSCWTKTLAKKLPPGVYQCTNLTKAEQSPVKTYKKRAPAKVVDVSRQPVTSQELVDVINNNPASTWKAGINERFQGFTIGEMRSLMGAKRDNSIAKLPTVVHANPEDVPDSFDPRTSKQWASCTGPVLDQGFCGSCWAFGATEAMSDRLCRAQGNGTFLQLAPLDITTCDDGWFSGENGCQGGQLGGAWNYGQSKGLVDEACYPYLKSQGGPVPTCKPEDQPCLPESKFIPTPACTKTCANGKDWESSKHKLDNVYSIDPNQLKAELVNHGPVESAFTVYADFVHYKSGVYSHQSGNALGGHAIKVIGYGTEGGVDYWLVQNSWTTTWGDGGYFKIRAGTDECGIEDSLIAGTFASA